MPAVGDVAPDFTLKDQNGNDVTLSGAARQAGRDRVLPVHVHRASARASCARSATTRRRSSAAARRCSPSRATPATRSASGPRSRASPSRCSATSGPTARWRRSTACSTTRSAAPTAPPSCSTRTASISSTFASPDLGTPRAKAEYDDALAKVSVAHLRRQASSCTASRRSGTIRHQTQRPRFSPTMSPASASTLVWCETVGCDLPERLLQVARADLARVGHQAEQPQAHRVGRARRTPRARSSASASASGAASTDGQHAVGFGSCSSY